MKGLNGQKYFNFVFSNCNFVFSNCNFVLAIATLFSTIATLFPTIATLFLANTASVLALATESIVYTRRVSMGLHILY